MNNNPTSEESILMTKIFQQVDKIAQENDIFYVKNLNSSQYSKSLYKQYITKYGMETKHVPINEIFKFGSNSPIYDNGIIPPPQQEHLEWYYQTTPIENLIYLRDKMNDINKIFMARESGSYFYRYNFIIDLINEKIERKKVFSLF